MINKFLFLAMLFLSMAANGQLVPSDPDPGCANIDRFGVIQENHQNTAYFIGGIESINTGVGCSGLWANIGYGSLNPGEVAFGAIDADLIYETTPEMVDISFDLNNTLNSLPIGQQVKIMELRSNYFLIADITLKKILNSRHMNPRLMSQSNEVIHKWQVIVKWYGGASSSHYVQDTFVFDANQMVEYNYIWDDSDPNLPVSMISLGGNRISVNPYLDSSQGGSLAAVPIALYELTTYYLGFIDTSVSLNVGDQVVFDIKLA